MKEVKLETFVQAAWNPDTGQRDRDYVKFSLNPRVVKWFKAGNLVEVIVRPYKDARKP